MLAVLGLLSGCGTLHVVTAENLCRDWRYQTVSKKDVLTQETAEQIEASNGSRVNWGCAPRENRAG
jgi:hypothetical protein